VAEQRHEGLQGHAGAGQFGGVRVAALVRGPRAQVFRRGNESGSPHCVVQAVRDRDAPILVPRRMNRSPRAGGARMANARWEPFRASIAPHSRQGLVIMRDEALRVDLTQRDPEPGAVARQAQWAVELERFPSRRPRPRSRVVPARSTVSVSIAAGLHKGVVWLRTSALGSGGCVAVNVGAVDNGLGRPVGPSLGLRSSK
jgi:hypothetical protein